MFLFSPIALVVGGEGEQGHPGPVPENVVAPAAALDGTAPLRGLDRAGQLERREAEGALHLARRAALLLLGVLNVARLVTGHLYKRIPIHLMFFFHLLSISGVKLDVFAYYICIRYNCRNND